MKINEITSLDEAPFSALLAKNKAKRAKLLGKIPGMKDRADNSIAQADMKATANNLYSKFNSYIGGQGKRIKQATGEDLAAFMKKFNYNAVTAKGPLDKKTLNSELIKAAKHAMAGNKPSPAPQATPAQPTIKKGTKKKASDGQIYVWKGAQWVSLQTGRVATRAIGAELKKS